MYDSSRILDRDSFTLPWSNLHHPFPEVEVAVTGLKILLPKSIKNILILIKIFFNWWNKFIKDGTDKVI